MADIKPRGDDPTAKVSPTASQRERASASFAKAVADIVDEKRFRRVRDLNDLEMLEAATELTSRK